MSKIIKLLNRLTQLKKDSEIQTTAINNLTKAKIPYLTDLVPLR